MSAEKRAASDSFGSNQIVKRQRSDADLKASSSALTISNSGRSANGALIQAEPRAGGLNAPVMELTGHSGEVFAARFDPTGQTIASGSMDRTIMLWRSSGQCENLGVMSGHKGAVLDLHWSQDSRVLFSASADTMLASWDTETGQRIRRHMGHEEVINSMDVSKRGEEILVSASDDGFVGLWDPRQKAALDFIQTDLPCTAVAFSESGAELYTGGIDNDIRVWDLRKKSVIYTLHGHADTITSLAISPDSAYLLSNSHDSTVKMWDIQPFAATDRLKRTYDGAPTGLEKNLLRANWSCEGKGERIVAGSGDRSVVVWETSTGRLLNKLPGHKGAVNDVSFHPLGDPVVLSASSDRTLLLGELSK